MPINEETYYNREELDNNARRMYRELLQKWSMREDPDNDNPTNDCLGIGRQLFCTHNFRRCRDYLAPKQPICSFMCELFKIRCPEEKENFALLCSETNDEESCSHASYLGIALSWVASVGALFIITYI